MQYPQYWDVVNEALDDNGNLRKDHVFAKVPDFVCKSFKWAHEANPRAKLFINDYSVLDRDHWSRKKSDALYELVKNLKNRGCPIHGVGFQTHVTTRYIRDNLTPDWGVRYNIQRYAKIGVETHMTEVDVACNKKDGTCSWNNDAKLLQGRVYRQLLHICLTEPNCKAFVTWGFTDKVAWNPSGQMLMYD